MFRTRYLTVLGAALILLAVLVVSGCKDAEVKAQPEVTSSWPQATTETVVPEPVQLPRWPLTGLDAPDDAATHTRVMSVKVENSPVARPQSGLQSADVVYESVTEGGITRFNLLFHSVMPESVGPVRSARMSDTDIVPQYGAMFAFSGASGYVTRALGGVKFDNLSQDRGWTAGYKRVSSKSAPHNLYLNVGTLRDAALAKGNAATQDITSFLYDQAASEAATVTAASVNVRFSNANTVDWTYDGAKDAYMRVNGGNVHKDATTGEQVHATNVVVMWVPHVATGARDVTGSMTYDIKFVGSGKCSVFHNGVRYDGTWEAGSSAPPTFKAADGSSIRLAPGNTWIQVVDSDVNILVK
ncbi:MAG: DUF3048 domain-containing protein [Actinomycetota bacterium]|jgi:hypothetical protein|nr:DUF3048 domain-containing protein [Actinomycetota bacterium]